MSEPTYRDEQLSKLLGELWGMVKAMPIAKRVLERVERRLKFVFRVIEGWDTHHAEQAETLIQLGQIEAANGAATMIFNVRLRADLYRRTPILADSTAGDRVAEAMDMERLVLE
jgi:hypothetical protein